MEHGDTADEHTTINGICVAFKTKQNKQKKKHCMDPYFSRNLLGVKLLMMMLIISSVIMFNKKMKNKQQV